MGGEEEKRLLRGGEFHSKGLNSVGLKGKWMGRPGRIVRKQGQRALGVLAAEVNRRLCITPHWKQNGQIFGIP